MPRDSQIYKSLGICTNCHTRDATKGRSICDNCSNTINAWQKQRRELAKSQGRCIVCVKKQAEPGLSSCRSCLDSRNIRYHNYQRPSRAKANP